ncbi:hypothetical protein N0V93_000260 [Gnomoniopsis smithogilvyi]|uniref:Methyltransferase domain-containing protein n=1 Tax=Gnomoniopsis smithogilvyi TaxID=1191159 RepID=A0A9W8Z3C8_9PEZI|nr:hypothetical protein N0V93_000260 [Gnomoniopsis smithogilvyi]
MAYQNNVLVSDDPKVTSLYDYRTAKDHAAYLLPHLKPNFSILDVGSGPGSITKDFAKLVPEGRVVGIDVSPGVVEQAKANHQAPNLSFEVGDATDLAQFDDDAFDVVHAHCVLMHVPDRVKAFKELRRVCKPGGIVASRDPGAHMVAVKPDRPPFTRLVSEYGPLQWSVLDSFGTCSHAGLYKKQWAVEAGFGQEHGEQIWEQKSYEYLTHKSNLLKGSPVRDKAIELGLATEQQIDELTSIWDEWAQLPEHEVTRECVDMLCFKAGGPNREVCV